MQRHPPFLPNIHAERPRVTAPLIPAVSTLLHPTSTSQPPSLCPPSKSGRKISKIVPRRRHTRCMLVHTRSLKKSRIQQIHLRKKSAQACHVGRQNTTNLGAAKKMLAACFFPSTHSPRPIKNDCKARNGRGCV